MIVKTTLSRNSGGSLASRLASAVLNFTLIGGS